MFRKRKRVDEKGVQSRRARHTQLLQTNGRTDGQKCLQTQEKADARLRLVVCGGAGGGLQELSAERPWGHPALLCEVD